MLEDKYYSISEVAKITKLTDRTIRNYLSNGTLKGQKVGGQWRFTKNDILALFQEPTFEEDVSNKSKKYLIEYFENASKDENTGSLVLNINLKSKDDCKKLFDKLHQIKYDENLKYKISFVDDDDPRKIKIVLISSFNSISQVLNVIKEFIL